MSNRKKKKKREWCLACSRFLSGKRAFEEIRLCSFCWKGQCPKCKGTLIKSIQGPPSSWKCASCEASWDRAVFLQSNIVLAIRTLQRKEDFGSFQRLRDLAATQDFQNAFGLISTADSNLGLALSLHKDIVEEKNLNAIETSQNLAEEAVNGYSLRVAMGFQEQYLLNLADALLRADPVTVQRRLREARDRIRNSDDQYADHAMLYEQYLSPLLDGDDDNLNSAVDLGRFESIIPKR